MSYNPEYFYPTIITPIVSLNGGIYGTVKPTDVYPAVDVTDQTQSPAGTTKPYQIAQLVNYILTSLGLITYPPVLASTTGNLTAIYNNGLAGIGATLTNSGTQAAFVIDGQTGIMNASYLIQNQTSAAQNGIYTLTNPGSATTNWVLTRATYFNSPSNIINDGLVYVLYGIANANTIWQDTFSGSITVGTTPINYIEYQHIPLSGNINPGLMGQVAYYPANGTTLSGESLSALIDAALGSTQGDIIYRNNTSWTVLPPGTNGQFLQSSGAAANPFWATITGTGEVAASPQYELAYYSMAGTNAFVSGLVSASSSVLSTNGSGVPAWSTTLPSGLALQTPASGNLANCTGYPQSPYSNVVASSSNSGTFSTGSATFVQVTNLTVTITTHGGPVLLLLQPASTGNNSFIQTPASQNSTLAFFRGASQLGQTYDALGNQSYSPSAFSFVDLQSAGTYTYTFQVKTTGGTLYAEYLNIVAMEI